MIGRIYRSLSFRLLAIFLVTSLAYGLGSRYAVELVLTQDYLREIVGAHIARYTGYLLDDLGYPPSIERARAIVAEDPTDVRIDGPGVSWSSDPAFPDPEKIKFQGTRFLAHIRASAGPDSGWADTLKHLGFARYDRHSFVRIDVGDYRIVFASPKIADRPPPDLTWPIIGLISIFFLALCYLAVRWAVQPIQWIKIGADRIGRGDLDYRIPVARNDELGELTREINAMADDVRDMLEAKQQLLLAISHELRSPLTRAKVALEFIEDDAARQSLLEDIQEMERLISDLLESERLNTRHSALQRSETDIAALLRALLDEDFADQADRLQLEVPDGPVLAEVDATRVRLMVKNLLDNALCHSPAEAGAVRVGVSSDNDTLTIRVVDRGAGMTAEQVARATEPFYRADPARCRGTGGLGLGLYLCRRIAEAHGGALVINSQPGEGTEVCARLPRRPA